MSNSGANFEAIGGLPEYSGVAGSKTVRHIKSGINSWIKDNNGMPLEAFGAKWNGTTDDSTALQEAMEASVELEGIPVLLPYGTGVINSEPKVPKNIVCQIPIRGAGMMNTTVKLSEALHFLTPANTIAEDKIGNIDLSDFGVNGNNQQIATPGAHPVVYGTTSSSWEQVNILNVRMRRIRTFNVPLLDKEEGGRRNVVLISYHKEPGLNKTNIEAINIRECEFEGGQYGAYIAGQSTQAPFPINVHMANIYMGDLTHKISEAATAKEGYSAGFQIGQCAYSDGKTIIAERLFSENSDDVGMEFDVSCTVRDLYVVNANNEDYLFNTFNCAVGNEPIVTKTTETLASGSVKYKVSSSTSFTVGEKVAFFGSNVNKCEVRVIKAKSDSEHIEFTEALNTEWATGTWLQQIDDLNAGVYKGINLHGLRTKTLPGSNNGLKIQNLESALPCPEVDIDGYYRRVTAKDIVGADVVSTCGITNSKTGNPKAIKIKRLKIDRPYLEYSGAETKTFPSVSLELKGPGTPVEIQGEINVEGPGITGAGKVQGQLLRLESSSALIDIDLITKSVIESTGGEAWAAISLNKSTTGDISGRVRHRTRASEIKSGGGTMRGVRLGKGSSFASEAVRTTLNTAEIAIGTTVIPVKSVTGFSKGEAIVLDAVSTTKSEICTIASVGASEFTIVGVGASPGTTQTHAEGAVIAPLKTLIIEDSDWFGLGTSGVGIGAEDENVFMRVITRGNIYPVPPIETTISFPGTTKIFQIIQKGQSGTLIVEAGTISEIAWSGNGVNFKKYATGTGSLFHVSTGDFVKITDSGEPTVTFLADRN